MESCLKKYIILKDFKIYDNRNLTFKKSAIIYIKFKNSDTFNLLNEFMECLIIGIHINSIMCEELYADNRIQLYNEYRKDKIKKILK